MPRPQRKIKAQDKFQSKRKKVLRKQWGFLLKSIFNFCLTAEGNVWQGNQLDALPHKAVAHCGTSLQLYSSKLLWNFGLNCARVFSITDRHGCKVIALRNALRGKCWIVFACHIWSDSAVWCWYPCRPILYVSWASFRWLNGPTYPWIRRTCGDQAGQRIRPVKGRMSSKEATTA